MFLLPMGALEERSTTMGLHSWSGPSHLGSNGFTGRRAAAAPPPPAPRTWPAASPPSSVLLHSSNGGRSRTEPKISASGSSAGSSSGRPIIGVLGGASAVSTVAFLEKLVRWSSEGGEEEEGEYLPFIVCSDPLLSRKLSLRETKGSSPRFLRSRKETRVDVDREGVVEGLRQKRLFLESSGARCIVMPCHASHYWHREVSEGCSVPFLHMGECVANELREAGLRPVEAGSNVRIGVLATGSVLTAAVYQGKVQNLGYEAVLPDKATVEHTVIPAVEALRRRDMEGARTLLRITLHVLLVKAVNMIIVASDDLRGLLPQDDPLRKRCVDPIETLARSTIEWAHSTRSL